jgi:peptidoglycan/LPS O-acetylase OafA/YrhL
MREKGAGDEGHEIRPLTALRFGAALLVFLTHYSGLHYGHAAEAWQSIVIEGHAGVTIFFTLSGFLLALRYFPALAEGRFSAFDYFLRRGARILPLYWVLLGLTLLVDALTPYQTYTPAPFMNWTLTQSYFSQIALSGIIVAWSLSVEESFYLIAPLILRSCVPHRSSLWAVLRTLALWAAALWGTGWLLTRLSPALGLNAPYGFMDNLFVMAGYSVFGRGIDFCIGIFAGLLYLRYGRKLWAVPLPDAVATALFVLGLLGLFGLQMVMNAAGGLESAWRLNPLIAFMAACLILSLTRVRAPFSRLLNLRLPVYLGRISYALYLLQATPLAALVVAAIHPQHVLALPFVLVNLCLMSAFFYEVVERPCRAGVLRLGAAVKGRWRRAH